MKPKLLAILPRVPFPLEKGDKLRAFHQLRCMSDSFDVYLFALNDDKNLNQEKAIDALTPFCNKIEIFYLSKRSIAWNLFKAFFADYPFQVGYYYSCKAMKTLRHFVNEVQPDYLFCQLLRVAEYGRKFDIPKVIDYQDVFSKGVERRIDRSPIYLKPALFLEYKRLLKYENQVFDWFDYKTIISKPDRDLIQHPKRDEIDIVPNGVDYDFFHPMDSEKDFDLVFTGNMGYPPNIHAAEFLVNRILPIVHKKKPTLRLLISGASPDPRVIALKSEFVEISGWVDDIRNSYARAKIFIAPMQTGTGLQNKLLEAMAMKIPSITSDLANASLGAKDGKEILVGKTNLDFAKHINSLLESDLLCDNIAQAGYDFVHKTYDWKKSTNIITSSIMQLSE